MMSCAKTALPILTICTSYDVFRRKEVPFDGPDEAAPHLWGQIRQTPFWGANRHFQDKHVKY